MLTIHTAQPARFALNVRVPAWVTKSAAVRVNNQAVRVSARSGTFLKLERPWRDGDTVAVTFPMSLRFEAVDAQTPDRVALMYGPLIMVAVADGVVNLQGDKAKPDAWIHARGDEPLMFQAGNDGVMFRPFYLLRNERYTTYCHLAAAGFNEGYK